MKKDLYAIFDALKSENLDSCRRICKDWKKIMNDPYQKISKIELIKIDEIDISIKKFISNPPKWSKLNTESMWIFLESLNKAKADSYEEIFVEKYAELNVKLDGRFEFNETALHWALYR